MLVTLAVILVVHQQRRVLDRALVLGLAQDRVRGRDQGRAIARRPETRRSIFNRFVRFDLLDRLSVASQVSNQGYLTAVMSKICSNCGKAPSFGHNRSHSMVATKRRFNPNLQKVRIVKDGRALRAWVCTRCLKSDKVAKA